MNDNPENRNQRVIFFTSVFFIFILVLTLIGLGAWYIVRIDNRTSELATIVGNVIQHYEKTSEKEENNTNHQINKDYIQQPNNDSSDNLTNNTSNSLEKLSNLIQYLQPKLDPNVSRLIAVSVLKYSIQYKLPPELIIHLIFRESSFNLMNSSSKDAKGLMQILPKAHMDKLEKYNISPNSDIFYIDNNIMLGTMILAQYFERHKSIRKALESYVGGEQRGYVSDILSGYVDTKINEVRVYDEASSIDDKAYKATFLELESNPSDETEGNEQSDSE